MSFLEEVYTKVTSMHLPVSSNDVYMAMKHNQSFGVLSPAARREKVRKALADLRTKRKLLESHTNKDGILLWNVTGRPATFHETAKPKPAPVKALPEKVPSLPVEMSEQTKIIKHLLIDVANAFFSAAEKLK